MQEQVSVLLEEVELLRLFSGERSERGVFMRERESMKEHLKISMQLEL
jgi:hypothetical protein